MKTPLPSRRQFLEQSALLSGGLLLGAAPSSTSDPAASRARQHAIRLGGPIFTKTDDPEELARLHRQLGYRAAYAPSVPIKDTDRIRALTTAFAAQDVAFAEVGRWVNLLDADPAKRRQNLETVIDGLALAEALGARCCVDIAGSFNREVWYGPHPDNLSRDFFDAAVENARKIIDAVKPKRAAFAYEMMAWALPDSPESSLKMLRAVDRKAFAVHLDPCNLVNSPSRFYRSTDLINECFDRLGRWIVSCHAKDLVWDVEMSVHFREVGPGSGTIDYGTYLRRLAALPQNPPLMLEHLSKSEEYDGAREHLFDLGKRIGIAF